MILDSEKALEKPWMPALPLRQWQGCSAADRLLATGTLMCVSIISLQYLAWQCVIFLLLRVSC